MKKWNRAIWTAAFILPLLLPAAIVVWAYPNTSPSALAAVRLKYHPPANWIRHYLGDDRYKIAGNVWRVVSTQLDHYYHRPNCPHMLRQPAGIVIGFVKPSDAEEGGYAPDPFCSPYVASVSYAAGAGGGQEGSTGARTTAARGARRIVLSDGVSTVLLPAGWTHLRLGQQSRKTAAGDVGFQGDMLSPRGSRSGIIFMFMTAPNNINVEPFLSPQKIEQLRAQLRQKAGSDASMARALDGAQLGTGTLGGLKGLTMVPGRSANLPAGMGGRLIIVGRGSRLYIMAAQLAKSDTNYGVVVNSFQPR